MLFRIILVFLASVGIARADAPRVVADIAPVHSLVAMVMDGVGEPMMLIEPGASPHSYALRPSEAAALETADLVVWIGHDLTPWLEGPLDALAGGALKLELAEHSPIKLESDGHDHGHGNETHDDHAKDKDHVETEDHRAHDGLDPHLWLDPVNAEAWLARIALSLSEVDPDREATYKSNANAAARRLAELRETMSADLAQNASIPYAVNHDAYGYFEARFGLVHRFAISSTHAVDPGPRRIAELREMVAEHGVRCIFSDGVEGLAELRTVAEGYQVSVITSDPIGVGLTPGPLLYMDLMHRLAKDFSSCR